MFSCNKVTDIYRIILLTYHYHNHNTNLKETWLFGCIKPLNHCRNLKNFRLQSNLNFKKFAFFLAEFFLESLNEIPTRVPCQLTSFAGLFHYTACI